MSEPISDNPPFLNPLKTNLIESPAMPGKIIRNKPIRARSDVELQEVMESVKRGFAVYNALGEKYGVKIPEYNYEVADKRTTGFATLFTYVDRIEGGSIDKAVLPLNSVDKLDNFYKTMIDYYFDVYSNGGDYWADFRNDQLVYGHKQGEANDEVYIVDLDESNIGIGNYNKGNKSVSNERLFTQIFNLAYAVTQAEGNLSIKSRLNLARQEILAKIAAIPANEPRHDLLKSTIELLNR